VSKIIHDDLPTFITFSVLFSRAVIQADPIDDAWIWEEDAGANHPQIHILLHLGQALLSQRIDASLNPTVITCNLIVQSKSVSHYSMSGHKLPGRKAKILVVI